MISKLFLNILMISVLLSAATFFLTTLIDPGLGWSVEVKPEDSAKLDAMSYKEAMDYIKKHTIKLDFIDTVKQSVTSARGLYFLPALFIPIFLTACITAWRVVTINRSATNKTDRDTSWIKRI